jgi:hypothetical protein
MIPLFQPSLPLLIKEKVEFYYYRQKWLERIKIMNEQYIKYVKIFDFNDDTWLSWYTYTYRFILFVKKNDYDYDYDYDYRKIYNFKFDKWSSPYPPLNYRYSSGLNDPSGYK